METQLKELHETHGYYVPVARSSDVNGISLEIPPNILGMHREPAVDIFYEVSEGRVDKYMRSDDLSQPTRLKVPNYVARCIIMADIILTCLKCDVSSALITNFDRNGHKIDDLDFDTFDLLDGPELSEDAEKEETMKKVMRAMLAGRPECPALAKAGGVDDGYQLLLDVFRTGGF